MPSEREMIFDDLLARLRAIAPGVAVGPEEFDTRIRRVWETPDIVTSIDEEDLPGVFAIPGPTTFVSDTSGGTSGTAAWRIDLVIAIIDHRQDDRRKSTVWRRLEAIWEDIKRALTATEPCQAGGADVLWDIESWEPIWLEDANVALGQIGLVITYEEVFQPQA